jgi:hypothetical protein
LRGSNRVAFSLPRGGGSLVHDEHFPLEFFDYLIHIKGCDICKRYLLTREQFERLLNEIYGERES